MRGLPKMRERIVVFGTDEKLFVSAMWDTPSGQRTSTNRSSALVRNCQTSLSDGNGGEGYPTGFEVVRQSIIPTGPQVCLLHLQQFRIHALIGPWARLLVRRLCSFFLPFTFRKGLRRPCRTYFCVRFPTCDSGQVRI